MAALKRFLFCSLFAVSTAVAAQDVASEQVGSQLPGNVRGLLIQEMLAVTAASKDIVEALARGEHATVADRAQAIHDSFILAQQMTEEDSAALHAAVPEAFLTRDAAFHELSAALADAARQENSAEQQRLFSQMLSACVECHSNHARDRFPQLQRAAD